MTISTKEIIGILILIIGILVFITGILSVVILNSFRWWSWLIIIIGSAFILSGSLMLLIMQDDTDRSVDKSNENELDYVKTLPYQ